MSPHKSSSVLAIIATRGISEVLHFSTNRGFLGCLVTGAVLPRNRLKETELLEHILTLNAPFRTEEEGWFNKERMWISYVNLSISESSSNLFRFSLKWHEGADLSWVIMSFNPVLMADEGVFFTTTNNIYQLTRRASGAAGLEALFETDIPRKPGWTAHRRQRPPNLPTCEQAEVLYPDELPLHYLQRVYVREGEDSDWAHAMLRAYGREDVDVLVQDAKFRGAPN